MPKAQEKTLTAIQCTPNMTRSSKPILTLVISERAEKVLRTEIGQHFVLQEESIGKPTNYLGGKQREVTLDNGIMAWAFGSCQYVQAAVRTLKTTLH